MKERTINLRKMLWDMVLSWRGILLCGIIGALLLGAGYYVKTWRALKETATDKREEISREEFTPDELEEIDYVLNMYTRLMDYQKRRDQSVFVQTPAEDMNQVSLLYYLDVFDEDMQMAEDGQSFIYGVNPSKERLENSILNLYYYALTDRQLFEELKKAVDLDVAVLQELINVNYTGNVLCVTILYAEDMDIDNMMETVTSYVLRQDYSKVAEYDINFIDQVYEKPLSTDLLNRRKQCLDETNNAKIEYEQQLEGLNGEQKAYVEQVISPKAEDGQEEQTENLDKISGGGYISKKYIFVGFVLGILLVCCYVVCRRVFSSMLVDEEHMDEIYGVKIFGMLAVPHKKRILAKVDEWLLRIRDRRKKKLTDQQKYMAAIDSIILECGQKDIQKLCLTGTEIEKADSGIVLKLKEELAKNSIEMEPVGNIIYDGESLKKCAEIGAVVVLEQMGKSLYAEIDREIKKMKEYNVCVLGALVLE